MDDEQTFQCELQQLKQRVSDMSMRQFSPLSLPQLRAVPDSYDSVSHQLQDLRVHLSSLQASLVRRHSQSKTPGHLDPAEASPTLSAQLPLSGARNNDSLLPSTSLLWQLFSTLRSDVQSLDSRVATLERSVSDVEDRVDRLDPHRFTPPASVDSFDDQGRFPAIPAISTDQHPANMPNDLVGTGPCLPFQEHTTGQFGGIVHSETENRDHMPNSEVHNRISELTARHVQLPSAAMTPEIPCPIGRRAPVAQRETRNESFQNDVAFRNAMGWPSGRNALHGGESEVNPAPADIWYLCGKRDLKEIFPEATTANEARLDSSCHVSKKTGAVKDADRTVSSRVPPEGVAFRDQEITRMDDLLRNAQESLRSSEQTIHEKSERIAALQAQQRDYEIRLGKSAADASQKHKELTCARDLICAKNEEISQLKDEVEISGKKQYERYCLPETERRRHHSEMKSSIAHVQALQRLVDEYRRGRDAESDEAVRKRDVDIQKLQGFIEQKDMVAAEQEMVIARGLNLIGQRDRLIERLGRELRACDDDKEHEVRQNARLARLLKERDSALDEMRVRLRRVYERPRPARGKAPGRPEPKNRYGGMAEATDGAKGDQSGHDLPRAPELVKENEAFSEVSRDQGGYAHERPASQTFDNRPASFAQVGSSPRSHAQTRPAHQIHRVSAWEEGRDEPTKPALGQTSPLDVQDDGKRSFDTTRDKTAREERDEDQEQAGSRALPLRSAGDLQPEFERRCREGSGMAGANDSGTGKERGMMENGRPRSPRQRSRYRLPLESTINPPLPVPVAPPRVHSMADIRSEALQQEQRRALKHRSMRDLRRERLRAYVETEPESGAERNSAEIHERLDG